MVGSRSLLSLSDGINMDGTIGSDLQTIMAATGSLGSHIYTNVGNAFSNGSFLTWLALIAAVYLFVLDRTNWRTNILTALLVPYIGLNLPGVLLKILRGDIGYWLAFIAVVLRLFFPKHFPEHAELPACLILLVVTAPMMLVNVRFTLIGELISLAIGVYLLVDHIKAAGGVRKAFAERGVPITIGIFLLFIAPLCQLFWPL
ncbi:hypothetical protein MPTK1_7g18950 [Marchantia polymorpha subsp. ruderalis]|uniref:Uncharacterized protein n=2 Tax=Marchantia polymorpha TaxID=3197 RepID=A0AAF6C196_MARPO|nr:hypothetical protein MARPO_0067s0083 [Marchantia polymorpha]BBN18030.1 hypothetical protein Mp_7g18950 [Marchantia polymorpha subsp. ruderalis]|eukprot:PTQ36007.1 hypothetical protein MARPO_0067s0083 [Marchantia polymorpha]